MGIKNGESFFIIINIFLQYLLVFPEGQFTVRREVTIYDISIAL